GDNRQRLPLVVGFDLPPELAYPFLDLGLGNEDVHGSPNLASPRLVSPRPDVMGLDPSCVVGAASSRRATVRPRPGRSVRACTMMTGRPFSAKRRAGRPGVFVLCGSEDRSHRLRRGAGMR